MNRRTFLGTFAVGLIAPPLAAEAQTAGAKTYRIGVLYPGADNSVFRHNFAGFRQALGSAGYVAGHNLELDVRSGDGRALAPLAADLSRQRPDLIFAVARAAVQAMYALGSMAEVLALDLESDPVASHFVKTLARPAGHISGVFMDFPELAGKWLQILQMIDQHVSRVIILWDPSTGPAQLDAARQAARTLKVTVYPVEARSTAQIESAFRAAMRERPNGMVVLTSPIFSSGRREIAELAARNRLPTILPFPGYADDGGLVSYGPHVVTMYAQAGAIALKMLAGTPAALIPVERPTRFTLSINLKTAKALGLTIPPSLLQRADQVIE